MRTSPSIVPHWADQNTYLVVDDFRDLVDGQYSKPVRIVAFNFAEG